MFAGNQIGQYRLVHQIGEGGMGAVWLAEDLRLGRRAAIKVLLPIYSANTEAVARFFNEARAASLITDPSIVQIFDIGQLPDGTAYIVMELLEGEALDKRLKRHRTLPIADALRIMRQVASALASAHAAGIVHRDLKPENVFLVRDPAMPGGERVKLLDFGIAKLTNNQIVRTLTQAVMGTPVFMSPEQCRGAGRVDHRADLYSFGCVLFMLVVGRPPFEAEGMGDLIAMHIGVPPPRAVSLAPTVPLEVDALIARCLQKDPDLRFATALDLASAIDALLADPRVLAPPVAPNPFERPAPVQTGPFANLTVRDRNVPEPITAGAYVAVPGTPTSATASAATTTAPPARRSRTAVVATICALGGVAAAIAIGATHTTSHAATPNRDVPANSAEQPPPPPPPQTKNAQLGDTTRVRMIGILTAFKHWALAHPHAHCPSIRELATQPQDGWGNAMEITCTRQPDDERIGIISAGPDGVMNSADDQLSWTLTDEELADVQGPHWGDR